MTDRPDTELLAELGPLRAVIAEKLATTPVHLGRPGGTDQLADALTLAVAVYCGREVLPADALALADPPLPPTTEWIVEIHWRDGRWQHFARLTEDRDEAVRSFNQFVSSDPHNAYRLVRASTTHMVEAEGAP